MTLRWQQIPLPTSENLFFGQPVCQLSDPKRAHISAITAPDRTFHVNVLRRQVFSGLILDVVSRPTFIMIWSLR